MAPAISRRTFLGVATAASAALAASRQAAAAPHRRSARDGAPRVLQRAEIDHFDPLTNVEGKSVSALIYAQLCKWRRAPADKPWLREVEPYLARSIEMVEETTFVVTLRDNIQFHNTEPVNGRKLDPEDVVATWQRALNREAEGDRDGGPELPPEIVGPRTLRFPLRSPYAPLVARFAGIERSILAREAIDRGQPFLEGTPIGTGPFRLANPDTRREVVLDPHALPWWTPWKPGEAAPFFDGIVLPVITDPVQQSEALLNGSLDYGSVRRSDWAALESDERFDWAQIARDDVSIMRTNTPVKPMDDVRVRQALSTGFSRAAIARETFDGAARRTGPLPVSLRPWAAGVKHLELHSFRPEQAKQLLAAAGFDSGLTIHNLLPAEAGFHRSLAIEIAKQLLEIGVTVEHTALPARRYAERARLARTNPEAAGWQINVHVGDRHDDVDGYLAAYDTRSTANYGHWGNRDLDHLLRREKGEYDPVERLRIVRRIQHYIAEEGWTPGLLLPVERVAWSAALRHVAVSSDPFQGVRSFIDASFETDGSIH